MADPVLQTDMLHAGHSDIRAEAIDHTNEIVREGLKSENAIRSDVKDAIHASTMSSDLVGDRLISQLDKQYHRMESRDYDLMRDISELRAISAVNQVATVAAINAASDRSSKDAEIATLKMTLEVQKGQADLTDKIITNASETRKLINELNDTSLNRTLIERNAELMESRYDSRFYRHGYDQAQWAGFSNQLQALNSQMQETRQGMVNFGTMAGVGQTSTSNNVR